MSKLYGTKPSVFALILLVSALCISSVYVLADVSFNTALNISNDSQKSEEQQIATAGSNVYVVWTNATLSDRSNDEILFRASANSGSSFGSVITLNSTGVDSELPQINATGNKVYVVWQNNAGGSYDIFFRNSTDNGSTFFTPIKLGTTGSNSLSPQLTNSGDNVFVVWHENAAENEIFFRNSTDNGVTFDDDGGNPFTLSDSNTNNSKQPQIISSGNNVYVVWWDDAALFGSDSIFFRASTNSGSNFNSVKSIGTVGVNSANTNPQITASGNDVYAVWQQGNDVFFTNSTDAGANFDTAINLSSSGTASTSPQITVNGTNVYVVWQENPNVFLNLSTDNGDTFLGTPINLSNNSPRVSTEPQVTAFGNSVHVTWRDDAAGTDDDIFFRSSPNQGTTFCSSQNIANNDGVSKEPNIAQSGNKIFISWLNATTGNNNDIRFHSGTTTTGCGVVLNATQYVIGNTVELTITDPVSNSNAGATDTVSVKVTSNTDSSTGITFSLSETGVNTGIFSGTLTFTESGSSSGSILKVSPGDTITATNTSTNDKGTATIATRTFTFEVSSSTVTSFEQSAKPKVVLNDLNANTTASIDSVIISISSTSTTNSISQTLVETGAKTGIFNNTQFIVTSGSDQFPIGGTITVSQTDGTPGVRNGGNNNDDLSVETITATVTSDTDGTGISLTLTETGIATNLFQGTLNIISSASIPNNSIQVTAGDILAVTIFGETANGLITPNSDVSVGALQVGGIGDTITASYLGTTGTATISAGTGGGGGGGGVVRPGLVLNAVAGAQALFGGGGGGADRSPPASGIDKMIAYPSIDVPTHIREKFENLDPSIPLSPEKIDGSFAFPLEINDDGYLLHSGENIIETKSVNVGEPIKITNNFYEQSAVEHASIYFNIKDGRDDLSDTYIIFDRDQNFKVVDRNGFFEDVKVSLIEDEKLFKKTIVYEFVFTLPMESSDIVYKMWDLDRRGTTMKVYDAFEVIDSSSLEEISEIIDSEHTVISTPPVPEWIKENVKWWADGTIEDSTFTAGIEYMIREQIIDIELSPNISKNPDDLEEILDEEIAEASVPAWIKNNAKWWADDLLSEEDFLNGIKYLVEKGIITI